MLIETFPVASSGRLTTIVLPTSSIAIVELTLLTVNVFVTFLLSYLLNPWYNTVML